MLDIDKKTANKIYTIKNNIYVKTLALNCKNSDILKNINTKCLILRKQDERKINKCSYIVKNSKDVSMNPVEGNKRDNLPVMAYIPWQRLTTTYDPEKALKVGTIFPELNKPFEGRKGGRVWNSN